MREEPDFLVIGSGPAGVSAAFPLALAGRKVLMIDGAGQARWPAPSDKTARPVAGDDAQSPKLGTPYAQKITASFRHDSAIAVQDFLAVGALSRGGLSTIWGGFVAEYDDTDLAGWPVTAAQMRPYYRDIIERIGVSGTADDAQGDFYGNAGALDSPPPVGPAAAHLLARFGGAHGGFALGLARNALITKAREGRGACTLKLDCLWGCDRGAIYGSRFDLAALARHGNFRLLDRATAMDIKPARSAWLVRLQDGREISAGKIILAAGCLSTTALAAGVMPQAPKQFRLLNNPVMAMPFLVPARLGKPVATSGYSLAQLGYRYAYGVGGDYVAGALYEIAGLPDWNFTQRLPLSRRGSGILFPYLSPAMLIATGYFPGQLSDNQLSWRRAENRIQIQIQGGQAASLPQIAKAAKKAIGKNLRACGAWLLPGTALGLPGTDVHYAGTLPMGGRGANGTSALGELNGAPGIHVVDGAALPSLSAKYPTLTIMANAARIGHALAGL